MSTVADIEALGFYFRRQNKPEPRIAAEQDRPGTGEMTWLTERAGLNTILPLILPGTEETTTVFGSSVTRYEPLIHPDVSALRAKRYIVKYQKGIIDGVSPTPGGEELAFITVNFQTPEYPVSGDDAYARVSGDGYTRDQPTDGATFDGGGTPGFDVRRPIPGQAYVVEVFDSPAVDQSVENIWGLAAGSVNKYTWRGYAPGTVLFKFARFAYTYKNSGLRTANYSLNFDVSPTIPWNQAYTRSGSIGSVLVGGDPLFPELDFAELFY